MATADSDGLLRKIGVVQATALNTSNVVGIGPFITIPLLMSTMGGPQAMLGWLLGAVLALSDGLVWSELGARWPGSGGTYHYFKKAFGNRPIGQLLAFLFIWQFMISGPLEIASGLIGFSMYANYIWPEIIGSKRFILSAVVGLVVIILLYRRINSLGAIAVTLWVGTILTIIGVIALGVPHFDPSRAFAFSDSAFSLSFGFVMGLGSATLIAMYDYLGYYNVCYLGDEIKKPEHVIPRSIMYTIAIVSVAYFFLSLVLIGSLPWSTVIGSDYIVSEFVELYYGRTLAIVFSLMILWAAFGSVFALMLAYSRIPYAAAKQGDFFRPFAKIHKEKRFPHVSLVVVGVTSIAASYFTLEEVVKTLLSTRIIIQFVGQIVAVFYARLHSDASSFPFKMYLYPVPAIVALVGWSFIFLTSGLIYIAFSILFLITGALVYFLWLKPNKIEQGI